jgi:hypothetical protein
MYMMSVLMSLPERSAPGGAVVGAGGGPRGPVSGLCCSGYGR